MQVNVDVLRADMTEPLRFADETFTAVLSDPPYGLSFMGKGWDHGVPSAETWREVWRVCKPGAVMLAFGGTRTWHRLAVAIEDAGWEIEDTLMWVYGSGFPKSHDLSKALDREAGAEREVVGRRTDRAATPVQNIRGGAYAGGNGINSGADCSAITAPATPDAATWAGWGTALKPAWEPVLLCRKPRSGTYAANALAHGAGALWVDGGRVGMNPGDQKGEFGPHHHGLGNECAKNGIYNKGWKRQEHDQALGRWPANLLLDAEAADALGRQSGVRAGGNYPAHAKVSRRGDSAYGVFKGNDQEPRAMGDTGTAARFFYTAKAARGERDAGLEGFDLRGSIRINGPRECESAKFSPRRNGHPCCKPLDLCRYLATLIRPPEAWLDEARLFVPYAGSGSEMIGAILAGWRNVTGIEREAEYADIAEARLAWWQRAHSETGLTDPKEILAAMKRRKPAPLFEMAAAT